MSFLFTILGSKLLREMWVDWKCDEELLLLLQFYVIKLHRSGTIRRDVRNAVVVSGELCAIKSETQTFISIDSKSFRKSLCRTEMCYSFIRVIHFDCALNEFKKIEYNFVRCGFTKDIVLCLSVFFLFSSFLLAADQKKLWTWIFLEC